MRDERKHVLACDRGDRLSRDMRVIPGENPARSDKLSLAGLGLQAADPLQVIQVRGEQWRMRIRWHGRSRKLLGRNPARKLDRCPCSDTGCLCRVAIDKPIDRGLINRLHSSGARHGTTELPEPTEVGLGRCALVADLCEIRRYAVHLVAQPSTAKASQYLRIPEIKVQHAAAAFHAAKQTKPTLRPQCGYQLTLTVGVHV